MRRTWLWWVPAALLVVGGAAGWALLRDPEPVEDEAADDDTGMSEATQSQLLQEIGYLKGGSP